MAKTATTKDAPGPGAQIELLVLRPEDLHIEEGFNPRTRMEDEALDALGDSIAEHGLLNPIIARPNGGSPKVIGGHRRLAAALRKGITEIPVLVRKNGGDDLVEAIVDNAHRVDLTPVEEAIAFGRLQTQGLTVDGIAKSLSVSKKLVTERLRLLDLTPLQQQAIADGKIGVRWVAELADLTAKHAALADRLAVKATENGKVGWHDQRTVLDCAREAQLIDPFHIEPGSWQLKLKTDLMREACRTLAAWKGDYSGPGYTALAAFRKATGMDAGFGGALSLSVDHVKQGVAGGRVIELNLGKDFRGEETTIALATSQAWVQETVEALVEKGFPKAKAAYEKEAVARAARKTGGGYGSVVSSSGKTLDEIREAEKENNRRERERKQQEQDDAREFNKRLGPALLKAFGSMELTADVVKWLCAGLLHDKPEGYNPSPGDYTVADLAADGLRFVMPELQTHTTLKNGSVKVEYITEKKELTKAFWHWWDQATTPEEVVGRTFIAFAAAHYSKKNAAMSKDTVYTAGWPRTRGDAFKKLLEKIAGGKVPGTRKRADGSEHVDGPPLAEILAEVGEGDQVTDEQLQARAEALDDDERAVLRALHDPKRGTGNDAKEQLSQLAQSAGLTQAQTKTALKELVRLGYAANSVWVRPPAIGRLVLAKIDEPKGDVAKKAKRARTQIEKTGVSTPAQRAVIAAAEAAQSGPIVRVKAGDGMPGAPRSARMLPDRHPDNPEGLVKIQYLDSRTAAWVAKARVIELDDEPPITKSQPSKPVTLPEDSKVAEKAAKQLRELGWTEQPNGSFTEPGTPVLQAKPKPKAKPKARKSSHAEQALALIEQHPGITIPELAEKMGQKQNTLYRIMPGLQEDGYVLKSGRGWHVKEQS